MILIGFDFSINKPAACINSNGKIHFVSWPYDLPKSTLQVYKDSPISIVDRTDNKEKGDNVSEKLRYEVKNSKYLATLILDTIKPYIKNDKVFMGFEGLSYGSKGDVVLQLGGYKYILMDTLKEYVPLENMYTYAPITIKKTAGCSEKGKTKADMIEAFNKMPGTFNEFVRNNEKKFQNKNGKWITHLDDLVDAYWVLKTLEEKL